MAFLGVLHLEGITRPGISEECTVQLYWVIVCCRWVVEIGRKECVGQIGGLRVVLVSHR